MSSKFLVKVLIVITLFVVRYALFDPEQGGPVTGLLYVGETVLASNLASDGVTLISVILSFIITLIIYYIIAEIITFILEKLLVRK